jgi:hypothetical protein
MGKPGVIIDRAEIGLQTDRARYVFEWPAPTRYPVHAVGNGCMTDYFVRFLTLVDEIERTYPVTRWQVGDVPAWPLARNGLFVDLYWQEHERRADIAPPRSRLVSARLTRALSQAATPLANIWRRRDDLRHAVLLPRPADVLFFGDELSLEWIDGAWRDRFFDPLITELNRDGRSTLVMQRGEVQRLPRATPVLDANTIENWGQLFAASSGLSQRLAGTLSDHEQVVEFLDRHCAPTHALAPALLRKKAAAVSATAYGFERLLKRIRPSMCIMMTTLGMGHALSLACRRRGVLSVEVQRSGMGPRILEYCWSAVPDTGYAVLPAIFWTWTADDAAPIDAWSRSLQAPWHRSLCGGHPQMAAWLDDRNPRTQAFDARINDLRAAHPARLEVLVALQNHDGYVDLWNNLAGLIERAPPDWRWWLRRHPYAPTAEKELGRLLALRRPNVVIEEASSLPLPALLRHMDGFLSIRSGAASEASMFGLKPIFLSPVARELFPQLIETDKAEIIGDMSALEARLGSLPRAAKIRAAQPDLRAVLARLQSVAAEYAALCANADS